MVFVSPDVTSDDLNTLIDDLTKSKARVNTKRVPILETRQT